MMLVIMLDHQFQMNINLKFENFVLKVKPYGVRSVTRNYQIKSLFHNEIDSFMYFTPFPEVPFWFEDLQRPLTILFDHH